MSESSRKILSDHNVSITNPRILVLEALMESRNPQTIDDLQKKLENKVAKSTLYRVLADLKKRFVELMTYCLNHFYRDDFVVSSLEISVVL